MKKVFLLLTSALLSFSVSAWELSDGIIEVPYNSYGPNYQSGNNDVLVDAVEVATGNTAWVPAIGDQFMVTLKGTANKSGEFQMCIVDERADANYWAEMCGGNYAMATVTAGEAFELTGVFIIQSVVTTNKESGEEVALTTPDLVFQIKPAEDEDPFVITNAECSVVYSEPANYENPITLVYSKESEEQPGTYQYTVNVSENLPTAKTTVGQYVNVTFKGTAVQDVAQMFFAFAENGNETLGYWKPLTETVPFIKDIKKGDAVNISFSIPVTNENPCETADHRAQFMGESTEMGSSLVFENYSVEITVTDAAAYAEPNVAIAEVEVADEVAVVAGTIYVNGEAPAFVVTPAGQKVANANLKAGVYFAGAVKVAVK